MAVVTGHGREWDAGLIEAKMDAAFKEQLLETCSNLEKVENGEAAPEFHPPSAVDARHCIGEYSYVEVLYLSPEQILQHAGALPEELSLPLVQRLAEDGETILRGVYLKADDLPEDLSWQTWQSFRKIRMFSETSYLHSKKVLTPESQISANQGPSLVSMLERRRAAKDEARPLPAKLSELKSLKQLRVKATQLNISRRQQEKELASRIAAEGGLAAEPIEIIDEAKKNALDKFRVDSADAVLVPENLRRKRRKATVPAVAKDSKDDGPDAAPSEVLPNLKAIIRVQGERSAGCR